MASLSTHLISGLIGYPIFSFLYIFTLHLFSNSNGLPDPVTFMLGYIFYILGSDLPDIDSKNAPIRRFVFSLITIMFSTLFYSILLINAKSLSKVIGSMITVYIFTLLFSMIFYALIQKLFFRVHRGIMHSFISAIIYACAIYLLSFWIPFDDLSSMIKKSWKIEIEIGKINPSVYLSLSGYFGIVTHVTVDFVHSMFKRVFR